MNIPEAKRIVDENEHNMLWSLRKTFAGNVQAMSDELRRRSRRVDQVADHCKATFPDRPDVEDERHSYAAKLRRIADALMTSG